MPPRRERERLGGGELASGAAAGPAPEEDEADRAAKGYEEFFFRREGQDRRTMTEILIPARCGSEIRPVRDSSPAGSV
jgi:hypothetical protein